MSKSPYQRAMSKPAPEHWQPMLGESVFVRRSPGMMSRLTVHGTFMGKTLDQDIVLVKLTYGSRSVTEQYLRSDIRPRTP